MLFGVFFFVYRNAARPPQDAKLTNSTSQQTDDNLLAAQSHDLLLDGYWTVTVEIFCVYPVEGHFLDFQLFAIKLGKTLKRSLSLVLKTNVATSAAAQLTWRNFQNINLGFIRFIKPFLLSHRADSQILILPVTQVYNIYPLIHR